MTSDKPHSEFLYVTFINTTAEKLWAALTEPEIMRQYWFGVHCESGWTPGSPWKMVYPDGRLIDSGEILAADPGRMLDIKWRSEINPEFHAEGWSRCTMTLDASASAVRLTLKHAIDVRNSKLVSGVSHFWPQILSNLKSLLETGSGVLQEPFPS